MNEIRRYRHQEISIPLYLILTLVTGGIFNLYWNYKQMEICNSFLRRDEFNFFLWIIFSLITCGLYHLYYQYKMGSAIVEIQQNENHHIFENLPIISILVTVLGFSIIIE